MDAEPNLTIHFPFFTVPYTTRDATKIERWDARAPACVAIQVKQRNSGNDAGEPFLVL